MIEAATTKTMQHVEQGEPLKIGSHRNPPSLYIQAPHQHYRRKGYHPARLGVNELTRGIMLLTVGHAPNGDPATTSPAGDGTWKEQE